MEKYYASQTQQGIALLLKIIRFIDNFHHEPSIARSTHHVQRPDSINIAHELQSLVL